MKRTLWLVGLTLLGLVVAVLLVVNVRATGDDLPKPDPSMLIRLGDGTDVPLSEVLARAQRGEPLPVPASGPARPMPTPAAPPGEDAANTKASRDADAKAAALQARLAELDARTAALVQAELARYGPVFQLAEQHLHDGNLDQALALYLSLPEDHPQYARSRRRIAWDILAKGKGEPERAVSYAHEALALQPFYSNSWQDAVRVYSATLGIDVD